MMSLIMSLGRNLRMSKFGRYHVPEPLSRLNRLHFHRGEPLTTVDHEPPISVLDQEDLLQQGIDCSAFIPGAAPNLDALGSCTANATTAALSNVLDEQSFFETTGASSYTDTKGLEIFAIKFYDACTHQTGDPAQEWPPTDCGSSGLYCVDELERMKLVSGDKIAVGPQNIVSLLQTGGVMLGSPWFNAWMNPDVHGFVDGNGSLTYLEEALKSGVAGGHETYACAVEALQLTETGQVIPEATVIRVRNSWTSSWGDHGCYRIHLSTWAYLQNYCDFRQLVAV